jgi:uncharacterized integral membrane protein
LKSIDGDAAGPPTRRERRGTGVYGSLIVAFVLAAGIVVGIIQNLQTVELKYFGWDLRTPLIVILLVTILATAILSALVGAGWRRRRRRQLADREELMADREELRGMRQQRQASAAESSASEPHPGQAAAPSAPPSPPS